MLDREDIERSIPHRPPFLWIDELVDVSDSAIHARKYLDPRLEVFAGHYPGNPILPGVLLCEAALQSGAVLMARTAAASGGKVPVVTRLNNVKFRRIVRAGETLDIFVELSERLSSAFFFKARTAVGGQTACTLEFGCTLADGLPDN